MPHVVRRVELVAGILLLYFALSVNPAQHMFLFLAFILEAIAGFYLALRFGKHGHARAVAIILSLVILVPMVIRVLTGALSFSGAANPAYLVSLILVGLLAASQLVALVGALVQRREAAPSA